MTEMEYELLKVLRKLMGNKHLDLGDLVYQVRDREGEGWEGEWVTQWGQAVSEAQELLEKYKHL